MQLHRARDAFAQAGARLVLIGQATPRHAARFREKLGIELPVLADEHRASYRAIGARHASVAQLLGPQVIAKGALASARSRVLQGRPVGDVALLGAAAVVEPDGTIAWTHRSRDASDSPPVDDLLEALRRSAAASAP